MASRCVLAILLMAFFLTDGCLIMGRTGGGRQAGGQNLASSQSFVRFRLKRDPGTNGTFSGQKSNIDLNGKPSDAFVNTLDSPVTSDVIRNLVSNAADYVHSALRKTKNSWPIAVWYEDIEDDKAGNPVQLHQNQNATLFISDKSIDLVIRGQETVTAVASLNDQIIIALKSDLTVIIGTEFINIVNKGVKETIRFRDSKEVETRHLGSGTNDVKKVILSVEQKTFSVFNSPQPFPHVYVLDNSIIVELDNELSMSLSNDSIALLSGNDSFLSLSAESLDLYFDDVNTTLSLSSDGIDLSLDEQNGVFSFTENYTMVMSFDDQNISISFGNFIDFSVGDKNFTVGITNNRYMLLNQITVPDLKITLTSELGEFAPSSDASTFHEPQKRSPDQILRLLVSNKGFMMLRIDDQVIVVINPFIFSYGNQQLLLIIE